MTNNLTTNKKSIEQRLIPFIYDRVYSINKGILRILILTIYCFEIAVIIAFVSDFFRSGNNHNDDLILFIFILPYIIISYYFYWTLVRIALWVYDGFKKE